jgi:hypothetical protein
MKTITLLFFTTLISFVEIYAYKSTQKEQKKALNTRISYWMKDSTTKPIGLTTSMGQSWKYPKAAENLMKKIDAQIEKQFSKKINYKATLHNKGSHLTKKQADLIVYNIKDIDSRIAELLTSKADIVRLSNDKEHIYDIGGDGKDSGAQYIKKGKGNNVLIQGTCDAQFIHEIRHISMSLQLIRGLRFSKNNLLMPLFADGIEDEIQGYRAQSAFKPNSLPGMYPKYLEDINLQYISSIQKEDGSVAYPSILKRVNDDKSIAKSNKKADKDSSIIYNILVNAKQ